MATPLTPPVDTEQYFTTIRTVLHRACSGQRLDRFFDALEGHGRLEAHSYQDLAHHVLTAAPILAERSGVPEPRIQSDIERALQDVDSRNGRAADGYRLLLYWSALTENVQHMQRYF